MGLHRAMPHTGIVAERSGRQQGQSRAPGISPAGHHGPPDAQPLPCCCCTTRVRRGHKPVGEPEEEPGGGVGNADPAVPPVADGEGLTDFRCDLRGRARSLTSSRAGAGSTGGPSARSTPTRNIPLRRSMMPEMPPNDLTSVVPKATRPPVKRCPGGRRRVPVTGSACSRRARSGRLDGAAGCRRAAATPAAGPRARRHRGRAGRRARHRRCWRVPTRWSPAQARRGRRCRPTPYRPKAVHDTRRLR